MRSLQSYSTQVSTTNTMEIDQKGTRYKTAESNATRCNTMQCMQHDAMQHDAIQSDRVFEDDQP